MNQHSAISGGSTHATGDPRTGKENKRGGKLEENHLDNPAGGPGIKPLPAMGTPGERYWMGIGWIGKLPLDGESVSMVPSGRDYTSSLNGIPTTLSISVSQVIAHNDQEPRDETAG